MKTPPDDPARTCGGQRSRGTPRRRGAPRAPSLRAPMPPKSLGIDRSVLASLPIEHVIVAMKENRSFDHLLGKFHDRGQPGRRGRPVHVLESRCARKRRLSRARTTTCLQLDPGQSVGRDPPRHERRQDGRLRPERRGDERRRTARFVMSYYDATDLRSTTGSPARSPVSDRHFAPMPSGTYANRDFLLFGTNDGVVDTGIVYSTAEHTLDPAALDGPGAAPGAAYSDGAILSGTLDWERRRSRRARHAELLRRSGSRHAPQRRVRRRRRLRGRRPPRGRSCSAAKTWLKSGLRPRPQEPAVQRLASVDLRRGGGFADSRGAGHRVSPAADRPRGGRLPRSRRRRRTRRWGACRDPDRRRSSACRARRDRLRSSRACR